MTAHVALRSVQIPTVWHVDRDGHALTIRDHNACTIARVEPRAAGASPSAEVAANVLAAAPELLASIKALKTSPNPEKEGESYDQTMARIDAAWAAVNAAIAKAEGRL